MKFELYMFCLWQVITIGFIEAGHAANVIPETVRFGGTFRSLTTEGLLYLKERIKQVLKGVSSNFFKTERPIKSFNNTAQ